MNEQSLKIGPMNVQCTDLYTVKLKFNCIYLLQVFQVSSSITHLISTIPQQHTRKSASPMYPGLVALSTKMCPGLPALGPF